MEKVFVETSLSLMNVTSATTGVEVLTVTELLSISDSGCTVNGNSTYNMIMVMASLQYNGMMTTAPFVFDGDSTRVFRILGSALEIECVQSGDYAETTISASGDEIIVRATYSASGAVLFTLTEPEEPEYIGCELTDSSYTVTSSSTVGSGALSATGRGTVTVSYRESDGEGGYVINTEEYDFELEIDPTGSVSIPVGTEMSYILDGCQSGQTTAVFTSGLTVASVPVALQLSNTVNEDVDFE